MVIPFHDVNPVRRTPWVTYLLIGVNVVVFLLTPAVSTAGLGQVGLAEVCRLEAFYDRYAAIPAELVDNRQLPEAATGEVGSGRRGAGCVVGAPDFRKVRVGSGQG